MKTKLGRRREEPAQPGSEVKMPGSEAAPGNHVPGFVVQDLKPALERLRDLAATDVDRGQPKEDPGVAGLQLPGTLEIRESAAKVAHVQAGGAKECVEHGIVAVEKDLWLQKRDDFGKPAGPHKPPRPCK